MTITTPVGTLGIRGTDGGCSISVGDEATCFISTGAALFSNTAGSTLIPAGTGVQLASASQLPQAQAFSIAQMQSFVGNNLANAVPGLGGSKGGDVTGDGSGDAAPSFDGGGQDGGDGDDAEGGGGDGESGDGDGGDGDGQSGDAGDGEMSAEEAAAVEPAAGEAEAGAAEANTGTVPSSTGNSNAFQVASTNSGSNQGPGTGGGQSGPGTGGDSGGGTTGAPAADTGGNQDTTPIEEAPPPADEPPPPPPPDTDDVFVYSSGDGDQSFDGGGGTDTLQVIGDPAGDNDFEIVQNENGEVVITETASGGAVVATVIADNIEDVVFDLRGSDRDITVEVGLLGNTDVSDATVIILGGSGDDTLDASGTDKPVLLRGGAGADILRGGSQNDAIEGGLDGDTIDGNGGIDTAFLCGTPRAPWSSISRQARLRARMATTPSPTWRTWLRRASTTRSPATAVRTF